MDMQFTDNSKKLNVYLQLSKNFKEINLKVF